MFFKKFKFFGKKEDKITVLGATYEKKNRDLKANIEWKVSNIQICLGVLSLFIIYKSKSYVKNLFIFRKFFWLFLGRKYP